MQNIINVNYHPSKKQIIIAVIIIETKEIKCGTASEIPYLKELHNEKN
jgi:hypothetical protein